MRAETLHDVLQWTAEFHQHLANRLYDCANMSQQEEAKNMFEYLADHEEKLGQALRGFEQNSHSEALDIWCYDHLENHPIIHKPPQDVPISELTVNNTIAILMDQHEQLTALYTYLHSRANTEASRELLNSLRLLEENEAKKMSEGANRMHEI